MTGVEHVRAVIAEKLGLREDEIACDASLVDDLGADSLDRIEMVIALERRLGIDIPDEDAVHISTVRQAIDYIDRARAIAPHRHATRRLVKPATRSEPRTLGLHRGGRSSSSA